MSHKIKMIHQSIEYLAERGYYGDFNMLVATNGKDTADYLCDIFSTSDGGEVLDSDYELIKEWLEE